MWCIFPPIRRVSRQQGRDVDKTIKGRGRHFRQVLVAKIAERVTTPIGKMIHDDLPNIPTGREADDVSFYHAFDKIIQVLLRPRPHQHGFGLFAREQAIEILRWRVIRKIGLPVPILFYEILPTVGEECNWDGK